MNDATVEVVEQTEWSVGPYVVSPMNDVDHSHVKVVSMPTRPVRLRNGTTWMHQKVEFMTTLFGKDYYWMKDPTGLSYIARVGNDGLPKILV